MSGDERRQDTPGPVPMWHPEAEDGLAAAILVNAEATLEYPEARQLKGGDFHNLGQGKCWKVAANLYAAGQPVTVETVAEAGGGVRSELYELSQMFTTSLAVPAWATTVRQDAVRRALHQAASEIAVLASDGKDTDSYTLLGRAAKVIEKVSGSALSPDDELWTAAAICDLTLGGDDWLLPGHIPADGLVLIAGDVGGGKSWLGLDIALAAASGGAVMGTVFPEPVSSLYLGPDNSWRTMVKRIQALCVGREIPGPAGFYLSDEAVNLVERDGADRLRRLVKRTGARLVVLDVFARFAQGIDENAAGEVAPVLTALRGVARATGAAFVLLHHLNKQGVMGSNRSWLQAIRGSVEIAGCVDVAYILTAKGEYEQAERTLKQTKNRDALEAKPLAFGLQPGAAGGIFLAWDAAPIASGNTLADETAGAVLAILKDKPGEYMTTGEIQQALNERKHHVGRGRFYDAMRSLKDVEGIKVSKMGKSEAFRFES